MRAFTQDAYCYHIDSFQGSKILGSRPIWL